MFNLSRLLPWPKTPLLFSWTIPVAFKLEALSLPLSPTISYFQSFQNDQMRSSCGSKSSCGFLSLSHSKTQNGLGLLLHDLQPTLPLTSVHPGLLYGSKACQNHSCLWAFVFAVPTVFSLEIVLAHSLTSFHFVLTSHVVGRFFPEDPL